MIDFESFVSHEELLLSVMFRVALEAQMHLIAGAIQLGPSGLANIADQLGPIAFSLAVETFDQQVTQS